MLVKRHIEAILFNPGDIAPGIGRQVVLIEGLEVGLDDKRFVLVHHEEGPRLLGPTVEDELYTMGGTRWDRRGVFESQGETAEVNWVLRHYELVQTVHSVQLKRNRSTNVVIICMYKRS